MSAGMFEDAQSQQDAGGGRQSGGAAASVQDWIGAEVQSTGQFVRQPNRFTKPFGDGEGKLPVQAGRYRLIWSQACPWAHRSAIVLRLLGLDVVISLGVVDPVRPDRRMGDWAFTLDTDGRDPVLGVEYLSDLYRRTDPGYQGPCTVPAVVDLETGHIVNNDYFQLTRYGEVEWRAYQRRGAPDLYPRELCAEIDSLNDVLFREVNNGVYRCGFAGSQEAYEEAFAMLFRQLDLLEARLSERRFLFGDFVTESDIRLYVTLARFDAAYYDGFRTNRNRLIDFPNLWAYARDLYAIPGFGDTTDFNAIKRHYHLCAVPGNPFRLVPKGPDLSGWRVAPGREALSGAPQQVFQGER
jgi:putative glutathione S-transferase